MRSLRCLQIIGLQQDTVEPKGISPQESSVDGKEVTELWERESSPHQFNIGYINSLENAD